jgi:hypothetical protein
MTHAPPLADLSQLPEAKLDTLIVARWTKLDAAVVANAEPDGGVALATALCRRGRRRAAPRQDAKAGHAAATGGNFGEG